LVWVETFIFNEMGGILHQIREHGNLLFSLYIIVVGGGFYLVLFRSAVARARKEVSG